MKRKTKWIVISVVNLHVFTILFGDIHISQTWFFTADNNCYKMLQEKAIFVSGLSLNSHISL